MNRTLSKQVLSLMTFLSLLYGKTPAAIGFLGNKFAVEAQCTALSLSSTAFKKNSTCTLGPFYYICCSNAVLFMLFSQKTPDQRRCAACLGFWTEQQERLVFTSINKDSVCVYVLQHLVFWTFIFKALPFKAQCYCLHIVAVLAVFLELEIRELLKGIDGTYAS